MYMYEHFNNIKTLYGNAYVQIPNDVFKDLTKTIKNNGKPNAQQISFAYAYLVTIAFLYKYAHFVDVDNGTYIQNKDIKQVLGYGEKTKTVDKIIKKDGILEQLRLVHTTKNYPVSVEYTDEIINDVRMREFITIEMLSDKDAYYKEVKRIVKNRNYEIKEPLFLFDYKNDAGSLYSYENTHKITIDEFLKFIYDGELNNIDFMLYAFFKYKCHGFLENTRNLALDKIELEIGIGKNTFYKYLEKLEKRNYVKSIRKGWNSDRNSVIEANEYIFKGISQ